MAYVIIAVVCAAVYFVVGYVLGHEAPRHEPKTWQLVRPAVQVEEIHDEGEAFAVVEVPKHSNPITAVLLFDGDRVRIFREQRHI